MLSNKKAIAMLMVISLILLLSTLGAAMLMLSSGHFGTSFQQIKRARAFYAAEAAMQYVLWQLRTGAVTPPTYPSTPLSVPFPDEVNKIPASNISIEVEDLNQAPPVVATPEVPVGVHPIHITVQY